MKILALADTAPQQSLQTLFSTHPDIDLVITLGDLEQPDISFLEEVTNIPKIGVYGNHCSRTYFEPLGIMNLHMHTWSYKGLTFGGFEGCVKYKDSNYAVMYTQDEASQLLKDFPKVDVFIAHCPPFGINDQQDPAHIGFHGLRTYLEEKQPAHFFHGHTYPTQETLVTHFLNTEIHYIHGAKIITI